MKLAEIQKKNSQFPLEKQIFRNSSNYNICYLYLDQENNYCKQMLCTHDDESAAYKNAQKCNQC